MSIFEWLFERRNPGPIGDLDVGRPPRGGADRVASYFLHPEPDYSNLGWFGGLIDNPFRYSDDLNRGLAFLFTFLWPGRFVANALINFFLPSPPTDEPGGPS